MKRLLIVAAALAAPVLAVPLAAQETPMSDMSSEQQAALDAWTKAVSPAAEHARLEKFAGNWTVTTRMWVAPDAEPETSTGTATSEMVLGGRYLREQVESQMMGTTFKGIGYTGYDNLKQTYVASWVDNFGTGILTSEGSWDEGSRSLTMTTETLDPMTGNLVKMRMVTRVVDDTTRVAEFYQTGPDGIEFLGMELTYTHRTETP